MSLWLPCFSYAETSTTTDTLVMRGVVLHVLKNELTSASETPPFSYNETVSARISSGKESGKLVKLTQYYTDGDGAKLNPGDIIFVEKSKEWGTSTPSNIYIYTNLDHNRMPVVIFFLVLFLGCLLYFGGKQGLRGLISLVGGVSLILFVFLPGIQHGISPVLLSIVVASFVGTIGAYITHGFSRMTTSAIIGMVVTIIGAVICSEIAVHLGYLSGVTDETTYNMMSDPYGGVVINFQGLLLGGIIIGMLGVLYDAAIGQAVAVEELVHVGPHLSSSFVFDRAYRIGREHIGALVNTLVLAYVGASLPIILMVYQSTLAGDFYPIPVFNLEFLATEVVRTTIGATALILTIPITTLVAVHMLVHNKEAVDPEIVAQEQKAAAGLVHKH